MTQAREAVVATAMRFYEMYNAHDATLLDDLLAPGYVGEVNGNQIIGREAAKRVIGGFLAAFPDVRYNVEDLVVEGDKVLVRWRATGSQLGPFGGQAPTGKGVTMVGMTLFQVAGPQIAALWNLWDVQGLLEQLRS